MARPTASYAEFDAILVNAIDEALSAYGEKSKLNFYVYLEKASNLPKGEIPKRIDEFSDAIEDLFGLGSRFLEILIMKNLYSKIASVWEQKESTPWVLPDITFKEYVNSVRKRFENALGTGEQTGILIAESEALEIRRR